MLVREGWVLYGLCPRSPDLGLCMWTCLVGLPRFSANMN